MPDSSDLGCAVRSDGSLKDASEIEWHYDEDDESPMASVSSTSSTSSLPAKVHLFFTGHPAPAKMVAGSRRSARALRPSARVLDPDNAMNKSASSSALNPSAANGKRKAPPSPPSRRIARKVDTDSGDECDAETSIAELSSQPCESSDTEQTENGTNEYEALQSMADADHRVCHTAVESCESLID